MYDFSDYYKAFEQVKLQKEFTDYCMEMSENVSILNGIPFDVHRAKAQINRLTVKYEHDLNRLANVYGNGMYVVYEIGDNNIAKNDFQIIKNELQYINNQIPIIAIIREIPKESIKKLLHKD